MLNVNVIHGSCQTIYRRILFLNLSNTPRVQEIPFYSLCSILGMKSDCKFISLINLTLITDILQYKAVITISRLGLKRAEKKLQQSLNKIHVKT